MKKAILILSLLSMLDAGAQDIHFSQYFFSPQTWSPAEIGNFDAQYRINANQRTQWREVSRPYTTFAVMGDGRLGFAPKEMAFGISLSNDNSGDSRFNTFSFLAGSTYKYQLTEDGKHSLTGGLQTGVSQIKINTDDLTFNNQYNGVAFDPNRSNGENLARMNRWYFNLNFGALYKFQLAPRKTIDLGIAGHNLTQPKQSFYNETGVNLPARLSLYGQSTWMINDRFDALPSIRWMQQSSFSEVVFGSAVRYILMNERSLYRAVFAGYYGRIGDSGIGLVGFEIDAWRFGLSYDINVSQLEVASRNRGGFEFSLQYLFGNPREKLDLPSKYCPVFL